jgi:hypothetical protein
VSLDEENGQDGGEVDIEVKRAFLRLVHGSEVKSVDGSEARIWWSDRKLHSAIESRW